MRKFFSLFAAVLFAGSMMAADVVKVTLDFTSNEAWQFPVGSGNGATEAATFSNGTDTIVLAATTKYYFNTSGYLMLGKAGSTLTLPAFDFKTTKIVVTGNKGASAAVEQNIYVGENAVSTETVGAGNDDAAITNEYEIAADYQAAGNVYVLKVTSAHNTQITKIEVYTEGEGGEGEGGEGEGGEGEGGEETEETEVVYDWAANVGITILGTSGVEVSTVKIHENADQVNAIKISSNYAYADGKYLAIKPAEGSFKAGDSIIVAGVISNDATDGSKYAKIDIYAADGASNLFRGDTLVNGKKEADEPKVEGFKLAADQDSILLGRYGNTNMFITLLQVVRAAEPAVEPLSFTFELKDEVLTITPSNDDPWAGMTLPLAVFNDTEEGFGGDKDAAAAVLANMIEPITGAAQLKLADLDPEEFPAGTECVFIAWGYVNEAVTTVDTYEFKLAEPLADPTTCAEAAEAALSVSANNELYNGGKEYTIEGYVTSIATAYSAQYNNVSFWIADEANGGNVLQAFRAVCASEADAPAVGDKVAVTGKLTKYNSTPEFAQGCTFVIIEKAPAEEWKEVKFTKTVAKDDLAADAVFEDGDFKVAITDTDNKMSIDSNVINAGRTDTCVAYSFRLKTGGKSSAKNLITITVPADGVLRIAARTGSNSDYTRNLVLVQGTDTLYNKVVSEASKRVKALTDTTSLTVYPYVYANVKAGDVVVTYPTNGLNFYEFGFLADGEAPAVLADPTNCAEAAEAALTVSGNNVIYNDYAQYTIKGYVTEIAYEYKEENGNMSFWLADSVDGGKVLEAYKAVCASEADAVWVGDLVEVTGYLTKYYSTPEFAAGCTYKFIEKVARETPDTIEITITEGLEWEDATAEEGWWQVYGENEEYFITLSNGNTVSEPAGTYTAAVLDASYSYVRPVNGTDKITFTDGSVTVTVDEESEAVLVAGTLVGVDGNVYVITLAVSTAANPYKYDEEEADFVYDFESYEVNDTYAVSNGIVLVSSMTDTTAISLYIILPQGQTELTAGEYAVSATPAYGIVLAGSYDDGLNPSFAATLIEYNSKLYYNEIWYLVSGTVTVDADLNITVDALNSNEKTIKATLKGPDTEAIDSVDAAAKAIKALKNGQLIIEKNGVQYNVLGTRL